MHACLRPALVGDACAREVYDVRYAMEAAFVDRTVCDIPMEQPRTARAFPLATKPVYHMALYR